MTVNEYGAPLDRAGYAESIMQHGGGCAICGRTWGAKLDRHEPFGGANREKSKAFGMWIVLCHDGCHEGPGSVHADGALAREWRRKAQRAAMIEYGWSREEFIRRFGKSELDADEAAALFTEQIAEAAKQGQREKEHARAGAGCDFGRARAIIREFWPEHQTAARGFRLLPDADLPF